MCVCCSTGDTLTHTKCPNQRKLRPLIQRGSMGFAFFPQFNLHACQPATLRSHASTGHQTHTHAHTHTASIHLFIKHMRAGEANASLSSSTNGNKARQLRARQKKVSGATSCWPDSPLFRQGCERNGAADGRRLRGGASSCSPVPRGRSTAGVRSCQRGTTASC